jgi:hypothetical protein
MDAIILIILILNLAGIVWLAWRQQAMVNGIVLRFAGLERQIKRSQR